MADWVESRGADLVVLAGYMQLLSEPFVARFATASSTSTRRCCRRSPGSTRSARRWRRACEETGVTVHFVDEGVDTGPAILQRRVPVPAGRERQVLEAAIHAVEHELYPEAIRMIAEGRVRIDPSDPRRVAIDD